MYSPSPAAGERAASVLGDKLLRGPVFLGADGCLAVQDWWQPFRSLSPPWLSAAPSSKKKRKHLTAKHPHSRVDNTRAKTGQWCEGVLLNYCLVKLLELENLFRCCCLKKIFFQRLLEIVDGRKISHLSHLFPEADKQAVSVKGQYTCPHFCLCSSLSWQEMTEGGRLFSLYGHSHITKLTDGQELWALVTKEKDDGCSHLYTLQHWGSNSWCYRSYRRILCRAAGVTEKHWTAEKCWEVFLGARDQTGGIYKHGANLIYFPRLQLITNTCCYHYLPDRHRIQMVCFIFTPVNVRLLIKPSWSWSKFYNYNMTSLQQM